MVTIKEIAREANVSPTTVSLILNRKSRERKISPKTEKRVLEIARRMGYLPNLQAVGLKKAGSQFAHLQRYAHTSESLRLHLSVTGYGRSPELPHRLFPQKQL